VPAGRGYRGWVTAAAAQPPHDPDPGKLDTPEAIRAALLPEEAGDFDKAWRQARTFADEAGQQAVLDNYRRIARQTLVDPGAHRRMLAEARQRMTTGALPAGAGLWNDLKAELGL
jgi:Family of unknown function (DUF6247)